MPSKSITSRSRKPKVAANDENVRYCEDYLGAEADPFRCFQREMLGARIVGNGTINVHTTTRIGTQYLLTLVSPGFANQRSRFHFGVLFSRAIPRTDASPLASRNGDP